MSGSTEFDLPLVFVGYGITAEKEQYDDYADLDVKGKIVVLLRHEPQQRDPKSPLNGTRDSAYAPLRQKVANAVAHGAAGVIFCTDEVEVRKNLAELRKRWHEALDRIVAAHQESKKIEDPTPAEIEAQRVKIERLLKEAETWNQRLQTEIDPVLALGAAGPGGMQQDFPVLHCRRDALDPIVKAALGKDFAALEAEIDASFKPQSGELTGWRIVGQDGPQTAKTRIAERRRDRRGRGRQGGRDDRAGRPLRSPRLWRSRLAGTEKQTDPQRRRRQRLGRNRDAGSRTADRRAAEAAAARRLRGLHRRGSRPAGQFALRGPAARAARQDDCHDQSRHGGPPARRAALDHGHGHEQGVYRNSRRRAQRGLENHAIAESAPAQAIIWPSTRGRFPC